MVRAVLAPGVPPSCGVGQGGLAVGWRWRRVSRRRHGRQRGVQQPGVDRGLVVHLELRARRLGRQVGHVERRRRRGPAGGSYWRVLEADVLVVELAGEAVDAGPHWCVGGRGIGWSGHGRLQWRQRSSTLCELRRRHDVGVHGTAGLQARGERVEHWSRGGGSVGGGGGGCGSSDGG